MRTLFDGCAVPAGGRDSCFLLGGVAAVDGQGDAGDVAGAGAAQPQDGLGDLLGDAEAVDGLAGFGLVAVEFAVFDHGVVLHARPDTAQVDGLDAVELLGALVGGVGGRGLDAYEGLDMAAEPGLTLTIYTAEPGSPSEEALRLLATGPHRAYDAWPGQMPACTSLGSGQGHDDPHGRLAVACHPQSPKNWPAACARPALPNRSSSQPSRCHVSSRAIAMAGYRP